MPELYESKASLRIWGEDLDPNEITALLGVSPSSSRRRGEPVSRRENAPLARHGSWHLRAACNRPGDLDQQVAFLMTAISPDLNAWRGITDRYRADIFCGLFLENDAGGTHLSPETLMLVAERGIQIQFDIYAGDPDDKQTG